jgi:hypothetical protein
MVKLIVGFLLLILIQTANSADLTIHWSHPTEYTDGSPLPVSDITRTGIKCVKYYEGWPNSFPLEKPCPFNEVFAEGPLNKLTINLYVPIQGAKVFVSARTWVGELFSEFSNEVFKEYPGAVPKPPVIQITVTP